MSPYRTPDTRETLPQFQVTRRKLLVFRARRWLCHAFFGGCTWRRLWGVLRTSEGPFRVRCDRCGSSGPYTSQEVGWIEKYRRSGVVLVGSDGVAIPTPTTSTPNLIILKDHPKLPRVKVLGPNSPYLLQEDIDAEREAILEYEF